MSRPRLLSFLVCLVASGLALADEADVAPEQSPAPKLPGIQIDTEAGHVELKAKVVTKDADWLELLACSPNSREYESILAVEASPRDVHLALMLLGLKPGSPLSFGQKPDGQFTVTPPTGPPVAITLMYELNGTHHTVPANAWVENQETGDVLPSNIWLFAGSRIEQIDDNPVYMADVNGTVISLVNFGDDLLARDTTITKDNDEQAWSSRGAVIPPVGTPVAIRLEPVIEVQEAGKDLEKSP